MATSIASVTRAVKNDFQKMSFISFPYPKENPLLP